MAQNLVRTVFFFLLKFCKQASTGKAKGKGKVAFQCFYSLLNSSSPIPPHPTPTPILECRDGVEIWSLIRACILHLKEVE